MRGPIVMQGSWNKADETSQALRIGWLDTGDMARHETDG